MPKKEHVTETEWLYLACFQILEQKCGKNRTECFLATIRTETMTWTDNRHRLKFDLVAHGETRSSQSNQPYICGMSEEIFFMRMYHSTWLLGVTYLR